MKALLAKESKSGPVLRSKNFQKKRMGRRLAIYASLGIQMLTGCANTAQDIKPVPVSATSYEAFSCKELSDQSNKVLAGLERLGGQVSSPEAHRNKNMALGVVLLAPAPFFFSEESPEDYEYSRLLGEYQALQKNIQERCVKLDSGGDK